MKSLRFGRRVLECCSQPWNWGVGVGQAIQVLAVEGRAVQLLDTLVPWKRSQRALRLGEPWRDRVVAHAADAQVPGEGLADEFWTARAHATG